MFLFVFSTIHLCLSLLFSHFVFLYLPSFSDFLTTRHILQFRMFDLISLQPTHCIMERKKILHSSLRKKKWRINDNQNKYSNIIIFGTKDVLFIPPYKITFFSALSQAKIAFSYHILMNMLIYILFCDQKNLLTIFHTE